jgi:hypothetical protein
MRSCQGTLNIESRICPFALALTPALSHPMGEGEVVPAFGTRYYGLIVHVAAPGDGRCPFEKSRR